MSRRWASIIRERYKVLSELGIDGMRDIIKRFDENQDYWDSVKEHHVDFIMSNYTNKAEKKKQKRTAMYVKKYVNWKHKP